MQRIFRELVGKRYPLRVPISRGVSSFVGCLPGLEHVVVQELERLSPTTQFTVVGGGVEFEANVELIMKCGLCLGSASHLMVRLITFKCRALGELERKAEILPWSTLLRADVPYSVKATANKSRVYHTGAIQERIVNSIKRSFKDIKKKPKLVSNVEPNGELSKRAKILVRLNDDICTISLEATPYPLYRRGYRQGLAKAPLREDIAYAMCLTTLGDNGKGADYVLDPFCGSGTIAIEAAGLKMNLPPGRLQPPPLSHLAMFNSSIWEKVSNQYVLNQNKNEDDSLSLMNELHSSKQDNTIYISASDRDAGAINMAKENATRAGVIDAIDFKCLALKSHPWLQENSDKEDTTETDNQEMVNHEIRIGKGLMLTNPPFGVRINKINHKSIDSSSSSSLNKNLWPLYQSMGTCMKQLGNKWSVGILAHDVNLVRRSGIKLQSLLTTTHGGLSVSLMTSNIKLKKIPSFFNEKKKKKN